jgi:aarF domain-containing kinase
MVSKEGKVIRQQLCKVIADALCQLMIKLFGQGATDTQYPRVMLANGPSNKESGRSSSAAYDYNSIFRDRRLRVIFSKVLKSASSDKVLMLRFCWSSLVIMITASTLACHRVVLSLSEAYLGPIFDAPKRTRYAVNAWYILRTLLSDNFQREDKCFSFGGNLVWGRWNMGIG